MPRPFEASPQELALRIEGFVDATYADLESSFLVMPRGPGLVEYARFQEAYETLKRATAAFREFNSECVWVALRNDSLVFLVLRAILGMTAPEWAYLASTEIPIKVDQNTARMLDRRVREDRGFVASLDPVRSKAALARLQGLVEIACRYVAQPVPAGAADTVHRLDKADTAEGLASVRRAADLHVPYAVLLYERYLGRPFASYRDSVSELVGNVMETAIEHRLQEAHVTFRKTGRAERVPGFDQAPDFIVPTEFAPSIVIEAKITNDDGTARDKFTRLIHLAQLSRDRIAESKPGFEVVACIDGRGFGVRREDMRRLLLAIGGKVFTLRTLDQLVTNTRIREFATGIARSS